MLDILANSYGLNLVETAVGFKEVCAHMLEHDTLLGGEESGGYTIRGHLPERDGLLCGVLLLEMMTMRGQAMSEIVTHLMEKAGYHTYRRIDVHTTQEKKEEALRRVKENPPDRVGGSR